jgi:S1-C subfamily serine protease
MKKLILATAVLLSFNAAATQANHIEKVTKNATFINTNKGNGAGFMIKDTNLMITNKHVANFQSKYINIMNSEGKVFHGQYKWHSDKYDVALVEVFGKNDTVKNNNTDIRFKGGLELCDNSTNLMIGEKIYGVGSPAGQRHVYREGYINSQPSYNKWAGHTVVQYQEYAGRGTSGSAIMRSNGDCVLGVNFAGLLEYDMGIAVTVEQLKEVLNEWETVKHYSKEERVKYRLQEDLKKLEKASEIINKKLKTIKDKINGLNIKIAVKKETK